MAETSRGLAYLKNIIFTVLEGKIKELKGFKLHHERDSNPWK